MKNELVTYRVKDFPEYHQWISKILGVRTSHLRINAECDDARSIVAAVESGRAIAITGQFITAIAQARVCFVPFAGRGIDSEVGLLWRPGAPTEPVKNLLEAVSNRSA